MLVTSSSSRQLLNFSFVENRAQTIKMGGSISLTFPLFLAEMSVCAVGLEEENENVFQDR